MHWYRIDSAAHSQISGEKWGRYWQAAAYSDEISAVFAELAVDGTTTYFFSPSTHLLAQALLGTPCSKPTPARLKLMAGHKRAWAHHFSRPSTASPSTGYEETAIAPLGTL
jgi:hypothetical protein